MPSLMLITEGCERYIYPLGNETTIIGRGDDASIKLPSEGISPDHASIILEGSAFVLVDNGSSNGSFVNGEPVARRELKHLDLVRFGNYVFLFSMVDMPVPNSATGQMQALEVEIRAPPKPRAKVRASQRIGLKLTKPVASKSAQELKDEYTAGTF